MNVHTANKLKHAVAHAFLAGFIAIVLIPFFMVISASFTKGNLAPHTLWPKDISLEHWKFVLGVAYEEVINPTTGETRTVQAETPPLIWFWNSLKVSFLASIGILLLSATCAYAFARMQFKFKHQLLNNLLILQMFPMVLALIAYRVILEFLGNYVPAAGLNSHLGLMLIYLGGISMYIWMIKGYFDTVPASMEESGKIDGATPFQTFVYILLPMSAPIFAVVFILSFISFMSEYPVASVILQTSERWTLAVGANSFLYEQEKLWGRFSALAVLSGIPITVIFMICQRFLISGMTSGGVKD
ncbi:maltose ABC transporter permease MalG [Coraliomargarita akajimensis]|uniref:Maltose/maltodextrin transport system permease protein MalG n=1 Tax=Coraliomargarita akajimensis (strain DSM 45221 / IAM 15411 / JCM 23193 / KCTC 12865 / 04OKA010-24) TaxID=583355 RepID=D5EHQ5_CORAD|nr:maltose ABC transporter permease MalG [Coraliomargarita akajimensis]ADE54096.1 binding-protein-dependent transport systems inner membrane component [Coraliomargarita akajimensis DSM 45221]